MRILTNVRRAGVAGAVAALTLTVTVVTSGPRMPEAGLDQPTGELAEAGARGTQEGIKVHGHWAIEVRNPDGSLAEQREFENDLTSSGAYRLAALLGREVQGPGYWQVVLLASDNDQSSAPCLSLNGGRAQCFISEPDHPSASYPTVFPNLTLDTGEDDLFLRGSAVAAQDGIVGVVATQASSWVGAFTLAHITPIDVLAGQSIVVTVTISFS